MQYKCYQVFHCCNLFGRRNKIISKRNFNHFDSKAVDDAINIVIRKNSNTFQTHFPGAANGAQMRAVHGWNNRNSLLIDVSIITHPIIHDFIGFNQCLVCGWNTIQSCTVSKHFIFGFYILYWYWPALLMTLIRFNRKQNVRLCSHFDGSTYFKFICFDSWNSCHEFLTRAYFVAQCGSSHNFQKIE